MQWRHNLAHFLLASVVALGLTPLTVCVDAQARIAFVSDRDREIVKVFNGAQESKTIYESELKNGYKKWTN